jgi:hypothetical protein
VLLAFWTVGNINLTFCCKKHSILVSWDQKALNFGQLGSFFAHTSTFSLFSCTMFPTDQASAFAAPPPPSWTSFVRPKKVNILYKSHKNPLKYYFLEVYFLIGKRAPRASSGKSRHLPGQLGTLVKRTSACSNCAPFSKVSISLFSKIKIPG